jgi:predicted PolB exonuclease-like 3'-5' exonuclease
MKRTKQAQIHPLNVIILDIETAGIKKDLEEVYEPLQSYIKNHKTLKWEKCGLYPEMGRVVCITIKINEGKCQSFYDEDEHHLLFQFIKYIEQIPNPLFVGVNIIGFDFPFLIKRMMFHEFEQDVIKIAAKPWENEHIIDLKDRWQMGNRSGISSLELMCICLNVESSKDGDVKGSEVHEAYYNGRLLDIVKYCERDVEATYECYKIINRFIKI